jgi:TIR domain
MDMSMSNGQIFISYRRDDSAGYTRAIYDKLAKRFTKSRIFMDVDAIEPGLPFDEVINRAVGNCEILLVMIGKHWMEHKPGVGPRINDEKDFVRIEIVAALSRNVRVIPVLLDEAKMPTEESLPEPLRTLARRNAIEISNSRFNSDVDRLIETMSKVLGESDILPDEEHPKSRRVIRYWLLSGFVVIAVFSSIAYLYYVPDLRDNEVLSLTTTRTVTDLCKELQGRSIDLDANNYRGIVGSDGIKLMETRHGMFTFEADVVFSGEDIKREFGGILRDPIMGRCENNLITLDRKLKDASIQRYTGQISKADTGRTEISGHFEDGQRDLKWSGWIVNASE